MLYGWKSLLCFFFFNYKYMNMNKICAHIYTVVIQLIWYIFIILFPIIDLVETNKRFSSLITYLLEYNSLGDSTRLISFTLIFMDLVAAHIFASTRPQTKYKKQILNVFIEV